MMPFNGNMMAKVVQAVNLIPQFMRNPIGAMTSSGLSIPQNIQNDPGAILNFLAQSGTMSRDQYNQAEQMATMAQNLFGRKP